MTVSHRPCSRLACARPATARTGKRLGALFGSLLLASLGLLPAAVPAGDSDACPTECLPAEAAWIGGIRLGATPADVQNTLGMPTSRSVGGGEDDGGPYEEIMLSYPGLEVFIVRGVVDQVVATAPTWCTAGGICPGITKEELRSRIRGFSAQRGTTDLRSVYVCFEKCYSDYYLLIDYNSTGEVDRLRLVTDRP